MRFCGIYSDRRVQKIASKLLMQPVIVVETTKFISVLNKASESQELLPGHGAVIALEHVPIFD